MRYHQNHRFSVFHISLMQSIFKEKTEHTLKMFRIFALIDQTTVTAKFNKLTIAWKCSCSCLLLFLSVYEIDPMLQDKFDGWGEAYYESGSAYVGYWQLGKRHGYGKFKVFHKGGSYKELYSGKVFVTPLPLFIKFLLHRTLWIINQQSISILKAPQWNSLISNTPSVQWNFGVKVYEIYLFFYVYIL